MHQEIIESVESSLDDIYQLSEKVATSKKSLFGLSFEDYDIWQELKQQVSYGNSQGVDFKWMDKIQDTVYKLESNKKEWKKFKDAYNRGGWEDFIYDVADDGKGNWVSKKRKLSGTELAKRKKRNKNTAKFIANQEKEAKKQRELQRKKR